MNTLKSLREYLNTTIIGQEQTVNAVTITFFKHLLRIQAEQKGMLSNSINNLLIIGKTGTGKTFTVKEACKALDWPCIEINGKAICQEGWEGKSLAKMILDGYIRLYDEYEEYTDYSIILIDEFDKMCLPNTSSKGENNAIHIQNTLLKYIEGFKIHETIGGRLRTIDTSKFCFIFSGAFTDLLKEQQASIGYININQKDVSKDIITEALINFGVQPEILGRITEIVQTKDFTEDMYKELLYNESMVCNQWLKVLCKFNIEAFKYINYSKIINEAVTKKLGARGLIQSMMIDIDIIINNNLQEIEFEAIKKFLSVKETNNLTNIRKVL